MSQTSGVTLEDVRRVAELANLELTAEEEPRMQRDLSAVLGHIAELNELDTAGVPAMAQVGEMLGLRSTSRARLCVWMRYGLRWIAPRSWLRLRRRMAGSSRCRR